MLTADRLLDSQEDASAPVRRAAGTRFVYAIDPPPGEPRRLRGGARAQGARRRGSPSSFEGGARFVPVLTRKGGVGKTTVTTLLGMALADVRDDRIIADRRQPRPRHARRAGHQADHGRPCATSCTHGRIDHRASTTSRPSSRATRPGSTSSPRTPTRCSPRRSTRTTTTSSPTSPRASTRSCSPTAAPASCTRSCGRRSSAPTRSSSSPAAASTRRASPPRPSPGSRRTATATSCATPSSRSTRRPRAPTWCKLDEIEAHFQSRVRESCASRTTRSSPPAARSRSATCSRSTRHAARELAALVVDGLRAARRGGLRHAMTVRQIRLFGDPVLRSVVRPDRRRSTTACARSSTTCSTPSSCPAAPASPRRRSASACARSATTSTARSATCSTRCSSRSPASPSSSTRAACRCPASTCTTRCATRGAGRRASTSTATRSCSSGRAYGAGAAARDRPPRRQALPRPARTPRRKREAMREIRESDWF